MAANNGITTVQLYLRDKQRRFYEAGMQAIWNELNEIASAALSGPPATINATDLAANLTPDFPGVVGRVTPEAARYDKNGTYVEPSPVAFR